MSPRKPDVQTKLALHMEATRKRDAWAKRGIALAERGNVKEAKVAQRHAQTWDKVARKLEGK